MRQLIIDRLEQYTSLDHDTIHEVTRQVLMALDMDQMIEPMTIDRFDYDAKILASYDHGHYNGRSDGADQIIARLADDSILTDESVDQAILSCHRMFNRSYTV